MKTASKTSARTNVENPELHFHFNWNPNSDSAIFEALKKKMQNMPSETLSTMKSIPPIGLYKKYFYNDFFYVMTFQSFFKIYKPLFHVLIIDQK